MLRGRYSPVNYTSLAGKLDHDLLLNFVAAEHIDWTAATANLYTTGKGQFDSGVGIGVAPTARLLIRAVGSSGVRTGIQLDNTGGGDTILEFDIGGTGKFILGVDNSVAGDPFKIAVGSALGTNDALAIDSSGNFVIGGTITGGTYNTLSIIPLTNWIYLSGDGTIDTGLDIAIPIASGNDFFYGYGGTEHHKFGNSSQVEISDDGIITAVNFVIGSASILEAELEILDGATVTTTELNYLDGTTLGTAVASKVLAVDANKDIDLDGGDIIASEVTAVTAVHTAALIGYGDPDTQIVFVGDDQFYFQAGGAEMMRFVEGKNDYIQIGGVDVDIRMLSVNNALLFKLDAALDVIRIGDGGTTNYAEFSATGSLALNGSATLSIADYTLPIADGSADEIIKTDGAGTLSFVRMTKAIYAELSDSTDQAFGSTGTAQSIPLNTNDELVGITHSTSASPENITIDTTGIYYLIAQPQIHASAGGAGYFHMWLQSDTGGGFADITNSNIEITLVSNDERVGVLAETISLDAGDIIRLRASVGDTRIELDAQAPGGEPAIPSIIFTMFMVGI